MRPQQQFSSFLLLAAMPLLAFALLHSVLPHPSMAQARMKPLSQRDPSLRPLPSSSRMPPWTAQKMRLARKASVRVVIGAASVPVPMTEAGRGSANTDTLPAQSVDVVDSTGAVLAQLYCGPGGPLCASGSNGVAVGSLRLSETVPRQATVDGQLYLYINVAALPGAVPGTYTLEMQNANGVGHAYFDVVSGHTPHPS